MNNSYVGSIQILSLFLPFQIVTDASALLKKRGARIAQIHIGATDCPSLPIFQAQDENNIETRATLKEKLQKKEKESNVVSGSRADKKLKEQAKKQEAEGTS